ncbi:cytochrome P450 [Streptomyces daliensis]|uniref:Cytochrome P450 n=1 Tax=Streptomyces daliensis TaxID=299421 RepID=A0A8T4IXV9_9ACTN|nr:cytochrome P450 [Streptomyces daliensis]
METQPDLQAPPPGCPAHQGGGQQGGGAVPLYGPEFAAAPEAFYAFLRQYGAAGPVELAPGVQASLVTRYSAALQVLQNPDLFAKDSRRWRALNEGRVPEDSPALPMLAYRPNCLFSDGADHARLRQAVTDSLAKLDPHRLSRHVERVADYLIGQFSAQGSVDLLNEYAKVLPLLVFNELFGCPSEIGDRLVHGMSGIFDGVDAERANAELSQALIELVTYKRAHPAEDVTSWLIEHPVRLNDEEMVHQLVTLMGAGTEPVQNVIANALRLLLTDEGGSALGGGLLVEDAIDDVLWNNPPLANYAAHYPVTDTELDGVPLREGDPVLISFAAANTDPSLSDSRQMLSKRAHLAWGAGPHACPAKDPARLICVAAVEKLLNQLPDIEMSVPVESLTWRPGPFHRALNELPAQFTPVVAEKPKPAPFVQGSVPQPTPPQPTARGRQGSWWSSFLSWWKV